MDNRSKQPEVDRIRPIWLIIGGLTIWGIYLAVGATGAFVRDAGLFDLRKFFVVLACSIAFLLFWYGNIVLARRRQTPSGQQQVSISSLLAMLFTFVAYGLWAAAYQVEDALAIRLGYVSFTFFFAAVIAGMIGASDRLPKRGKPAALIALALDFIAVVLFVLQVNAYISR